MAEQKLILIVDDDYELSDGIRAVLENQGHKVMQARDRALAEGVDESTMTTMMMEAANG